MQSSRGLFRVRIRNTQSRFLPPIQLIAVALCLSLVGCNKEAASQKSKPDPPSHVDKTAKEDQLNTIVLKPQAAERLGIATANVEARSIRRTRTYGGEVTLPTGALIIVSAPLTGTLQAVGNEPVPAVGTPLRIGHPVFQLMPMLSPEREVLTPSERIRFAEAQNTIATARIDAAGQVEQAQVQVEATKISLERAERLLREKAGTKKAVDDAQAQLSLAEKGLAAAEARKKQVDQISLEDTRDSGRLSPLPIVAPHDGIIRTRHAMVGEVVTAGTPLFEVMQCDPVWLKVAVYVGDLSEIDQSATAKVGPLSNIRGGTLSDAIPVPAPPTANALASTVDLYYELKNPKSQYRPGQRLAVTISLQGESEQLGVPWSAVVHDINGGTWVYEQIETNTFVRRRVQIQYLADNWASFERGPAKGAKIVVEGVAELFGTEFGFGK